MRSAAALLTIGLALIVARAAGAAGPVVTYTVTAGSMGDNGWYRSAVTAQLSVQGATDSTCPLVKTFRTSSDAVDCTATDGSSTVEFHLQFKMNTDAPAVTTASPDRAPIAGRWYSHPVVVVFSGNDTTSGIASCTTATYSGPDSGSATVTGSCRDNAGNVSATASFGLRYDTTPPTVAAKLSRAPDANGWYSHPVTVSFAGTDGGSSDKLSRTAPVSYSGPDSAKATISGGWLDARRQPRLGIGEPAIRLDCTQARGRRRRRRLAQRDAELARAHGNSCVDRPHPRPRQAAHSRPVSRQRIELPRHAAPAGRQLPVPARGDGRCGQHERRVPGGARPVSLSPGCGRAGQGQQPARLGTRQGIVVLQRPDLSRHAQGAECLAEAAELKLPRAWSFDGKRNRLAPGRYRWYVWPGRGPLRAAHYGRLLGGNSFVVR